MFTRSLQAKLRKALSRSPVVLLTGARQVGKTILVQEIARENNYSYMSLDDVPTLLAAKADPVSFIKNSQKPIIIDEVQRVPELFLAIKQYVDNDRVAGNFLLTGSVNPLLVPKVADALTGRIEQLTLFPLSQGEITGVTENFIELVFSGKPLVQPKNKIDKDILFKKIIIGGYPLLQNFNDEERTIWVNEYIQNIVQKDAQDISKISEPTDLYAFFYAFAYRTASLLNVSDIARSLQSPTATLNRYASLLEALYMIYIQRAWYKQRQKQFIKSKKAYLVDTGFLCHLLKIKTPEDLVASHLMGNIFENFVFLELLKQQGWSKTRVELFYFRTTSGNEVDIVLEDEKNNIVGIEVKSSSTVTPDDFKGLAYLQENAGKQFVQGIVLYTGDKIIPFGPNFYAVPLETLWSI